VYLAFGHDEEVGGKFGAGAMGRLLEGLGREFDHILDEGGSVLTDGVSPITRTPVAVVGVSEKAGNLSSQYWGYDVGKRVVWPAGRV
jgi:carboxypeptidase PM20D1